VLHTHSQPLQPLHLCSHLDPYSLTARLVVRIPA
jgi:hypothetical protein